MLVVLLAIGTFVADAGRPEAACTGSSGRSRSSASSGSSCARVLIWLTATYTITTRRLITRHGVITRRGHDIPLSRISDVAYEKDLIDRLLGCGTLVISDASTHGQVALPDIPRVEETQRKLNNLLHDLHSDDPPRRRCLTTQHRTTRPGSGHGPRAAHPRRAAGLQRGPAGRGDRGRPRAGPPAVARARLPRARHRDGVHQGRRPGAVHPGRDRRLGADRLRPGDPPDAGGRPDHGPALRLGGLGPADPGARAGPRRGDRETPTRWPSGCG